MTLLKSSQQIGERIKERRRELGITQEKLAEKLDVSYQQVQRYEKGSNALNTEKLQIMASCLNVPIGFFFEGNITDAREESIPYLPDEEGQALSLFRRINEEDRKTVLQVMKIAVRKNR